MKCLKLLPICALNLILFLSPLWSLTLTKSELEKIAKRELEKNFPNAVLKGLTFYGNRLTLPDQPLEFEVVRKKTFFVLKIENPLSGKVLREIPLKVGILEKVPVAVRDIKAGETITEGDIKWVYRPINGFKRFENPVGKVAKVSIKRNSTITPQMVEEKRVTAGRRVRVIFIKGNLVVETFGVLLDNGKRGQTVRVKRGKKIFEGILKDENTVVVNLY